MIGKPIICSPVAPGPGDDMAGVCSECNGLLVDGCCPTCGVCP